MKLIKVAAASLNQTPLDWHGNAERIARALEEAKAAGVHLLCLPELCISGYGCEDAFQSPGTRRMARRVLRELLPQTTGIAVSFGLPVRHDDHLYDCAAFVVDGRIVGIVPKRHLAGDGLHYEPRWFRAWPPGEVSEVDFDGECLPFGDLSFELGSLRVGFEICEEAWVASRPGAALAERGIDVILNPSASHFAFDKHEIRKRFVIEGSRAFGAIYVYANLNGNEAGRAIYDGGSLIAVDGEWVAAGPRFFFDTVSLTTAVVDVDCARRTLGGERSAAKPAVPSSDSRLRVRFEFDDSQPEAARLEIPTWQTGPDRKQQEFARAVRLGLFDYMRKSRSRGFIVSLSGGADSAACACLVAMMLDGARGELGEDGLRERLAYLGSDAATTVSELLVCVYQATRNSSQVTRDAAAAVARELGARFEVLDVEPIAAQYRDLIAGAIGRPLEWSRDDLALQNIQARVRAPSVWLLANLTGALLIATSNRSEAAVGYTTMDGDTCGGLSPIAGIDKAFLRQWLMWLETRAEGGIARVAALAYVNRQAPTAELRPPGAKQTDEDDLMPYAILDRIERAAIGHKQTPVEIYRRLLADQPERGATREGKAQLLTWLERFFRLWSRNQWKRERYAPSFHLDDENLDPKTWCRFPILSGGFERELEDLRALVERDDVSDA